jgi:hypothetical protein
MTNRINPMGHRMQAPNRKPMVHRVFPQPPLQQLPPPHHPMLPLRQLSYERIPGRASPSQPAYIAG